MKLLEMERDAGGQSGGRQYRSEVCACVRVWSGRTFLNDEALLK